MTISLTLPLIRRRLRALWAGEQGQVLILSAVMLVALLGMAALSIDIAHLRYSYYTLQATTDAAALAAARAIPTAASTSAITGPGGVVVAYSAAATGYNNRAGLPSVTVASTLKCLTTLQAQGLACIGTVPYNAIQVVQSSVVPMYFAGIFGRRTMTVSSASTAAISGGAPRASNVAIIVDATLSMNTYDADCGATQMQCATSGVQILLKALNPCGLYQSSCATLGVITNSFDRVSLFTFPNVTIGTAPIDSNCTTPIPAPNGSNGYSTSSVYGNYSMLPANPWSGVPTSLAYSFPIAGAPSYAPSGSSTPTYQLTGYLSDFRTSDTATTLNPNSDVVQAAGGASGCGSMLTPNYAGEHGTYYAGAIYAAQSSLVAQQLANPGSENVLILLSDGDAHAQQTLNGYTNFGPPATSNGSYPSWIGECGQGIVAADAATSAGTRVYTIAYGAPQTGCSTDQNAGSYPNISPCNAMADMASAPQYFYSDYNQTGANSTCVASQPVVSLSGIFLAISAQLSQARLIPNNTT